MYIFIKNKMKKFLSIVPILLLASIIQAQSTKERLIMVMDQNKYLNDKLKSLSDRLEKQEKLILTQEGKIQNLESKIQTLESRTIALVNQQALINYPKSTTENIGHNKLSEINEEPKLQKNNTQNFNESSKDFGRCKAITQKGTRCSRQGGATGYCWQHNK